MNYELKKQNSKSGNIIYELRDEKKHKFKDSPLGRIPEEWEVVRLGEVCDLSYGKNLPCCNFVEDGKYKVYGANGIIGYYNKYTHDDGCVLVSCRGEYSGVINLSEPKSFITNNSIPLVIKNQNLLFKKFLFYSLKSIPREKFVSGSAQPQVIINDLKTLIFPIPSIQAEQQKIAEILSQVDEVIEKETAYKEKLQRIKAGLMEDLLTGKVRVMGDSEGDGDGDGDGDGEGVL